MRLVAFGTALTHFGGRDVKDQKKEVVETVDSTSSLNKA